MGFPLSRCPGPARTPNPDSGPSCPTVGRFPSPPREAQQLPSPLLLRLRRLSLDSCLYKPLGPLAGPSSVFFDTTDDYDNSPAQPFLQHSTLFGFLPKPKLFLSPLCRWVMLWPWPRTRAAGSCVRPHSPGLCGVPLVTPLSSIGLFTSSWEPRKCCQSLFRC